MRLFRTLYLASSLLILVATLPTRAWAQDDQVKLTGDMVENFIAAHGELAALAAGLAKKYGDRSDTPGDDPVASLPAFQDIAEAKTQTTALLAKYHFDNLDDLEVVTNSVMLAYQADVPDSGGDQATAPSGPQQDDLDAERAKARLEVEADTSLTPDKKKEALQQIDDQYASLEASTPLSGNAEVVRPYLDRLKPIADAN